MTDRYAIAEHRRLFDATPEFALAGAPLLSQFAQPLRIAAVDVFAEVETRVAAALEALKTEGALARRRADRRHRGRDAARSDPRRSRLQRGDGAGQARAHEAARHRRRAAGEARGRSGSRRGRRGRRARLPQSHDASPSSGTASCAPSSKQGADYGRSNIGNGKTHQRRVRLGQSDRADARRPLPRRRVRRRARQSAGLRRLRRHARVLHQRRRRPGRRARALGVPALPRGAGRGHRRHPGRASIPATT